MAPGAKSPRRSASRSNSGGSRRLWWRHGCTGLTWCSAPGRVPELTPTPRWADPAEIAAVGWFDPVALPELQPETASALVALARRDRDTLGGDVQAQR